MKPEIIVGEIIGKGSEARQEIKVNDWTLTRFGEEEEPRVRDTDLAEKLGFDKVRGIRDLIKSMIKDGRLDCDVLRRLAVRRQKTKTGEREYEVEEFWLTEVESVIVTTQSKTGIAKKMLRPIAEVFVAARKGLLPSQSITLQQVDHYLTNRLAPLLQENRQLRERLDNYHHQIEEVRQLAHDGSAFIGPKGKARICSLLMEIADCRTDGDRKKRRSERKRIENQLRNEFDHNGPNSGWENYPNGKPNWILLRRLFDLRQDATVQQAIRNKSKQMRFFDGSASSQKPS